MKGFKLYNCFATAFTPHWIEQPPYICVLNKGQWWTRKRCWSSCIKKMIDEIQDYAIILMDIDGTILYWNKRAEKLRVTRTKKLLVRISACFTCRRTDSLDSPNNSFSWPKKKAERGMSEDAWEKTEPYFEAAYSLLPCTMMQVKWLASPNWLRNLPDGQTS